ncbi:MAG: hypothetical protein WC789_03655 [Lentisphaeria bacterium]|jgi:hypothetical protein
MKTAIPTILSLILFASLSAWAAEESVVLPALEDTAPSPGHRSKIIAPEYQGTGVYHTLYLPADWKEGNKYPVIVEYPANGITVDGRFIDGKDAPIFAPVLGYYISGGKGVIVMVMPFINKAKNANQDNGFGVQADIDIDATAEYCRVNVKRACDTYGGDPANIYIAGFSRGATACGWVGLHDDKIAALWAGFIANSTFDDGTYTGNAFKERAARVKGRPVLIVYEHTDAFKASSLKGVGILEKLGEKPTVIESFAPPPGHCTIWITKDSPERQQVRRWFADAVKRNSK